MMMMLTLIGVLQLITADVFHKLVQQVQPNVLIQWLLSHV